MVAGPAAEQDGCGFKRVKDKTKDITGEITAAGLARPNSGINMAGPSMHEMEGPCPVLPR
jgi:hypothetical protein